MGWDGKGEGREGREREVAVADNNDHRMEYLSSLQGRWQTVVGELCGDTRWYII